MNCPQCQCYCPPDSRECPCGYRFPEEAAPSPRAAEKRAGSRSGGLAHKVRWLRLGFLLSLLLWALALWRDDRLPPPGAILPTLFAEPLQAADGVPPPFAVTVKKRNYVVRPLFRYEIAGLVVSRHRSDSFLDTAHRQWRDTLNIMDLCLVWGRNIRSGVYRAMKFWNRDFTCMCAFPDAETGMLFSGSHLANNHLLSADRSLSRRMLRVRPGDQVRIAGFLAEYGQPANGFSRGTSTVRDDTGNGACETIFVTDFQVLRRANPGWRAAKPLALAAAGVLLALLLLA
jgi:hypothetical protein